MFQREVEKEEKLKTNKQANDTDLKSPPCKPRSLVEAVK